MKTIKEILFGKRKEEVTKAKPLVTTQNNNASYLGVKYHCSMNCEGGKTYDNPGSCPVCNMRLVPLNKPAAGNHQHHHCC